MTRIQQAEKPKSCKIKWWKFVDGGENYDTSMVDDSDDEGGDDDSDDEGDVRFWLLTD